VNEMIVDQSVITLVIVIGAMTVMAIDAWKN
jgi:hypothetical protein